MTEYERQSLAMQSLMLQGVVLQLRLQFQNYGAHRFDPATTAACEEFERDALAAAAAVRRVAEQADGER